MKNKTAMPGTDMKWRAESDLRTLVEAREIRADKPRYSAAMKMAKEKLEVMKDIAGA